MNIKPFFSSPKEVNIENYLNSYGIYNVEEFLDPPMTSLENCKKYKNINEAVSLLCELDEESTVCIVQDSDVDGLMSAVLAYRFLTECIGVDSIDVKFHTRKQHGLKDMVEQILPFYDLIWVPDAGTNDVSYCKYFFERGVPVLITDHHMPEVEVLKNGNPYAVCVNNQLSPQVKNKSLSGTGVTYKVIEAYCVKQGLSWYSLQREYVAIANIADVMSMTSLENRLFNLLGLKEIRNPFLYKIVKKFVKGYKQGNLMSPQDISWGVAPKLNAICRSDNQSAKSNIFYALAEGVSDKEAKHLIESLIYHYEKQNEQIEELYEEALKKSPIYDENITVIQGVSSPFTGLIANKFLSYYNKPVFFVHCAEGDTAYRGSVRSNYPARTLTANSGVMEVCAGHEQAFGVEWPKDKTKALFDYFENLDITTGAIPVTASTDSIMKIPESFYTLGYDYKTVWGEGIPAPTIHLTGIQIHSKDIQEMRNNTIKFQLGNVSFLKFKTPKPLKEKLGVGESKWVNLEIIGTAGINIWRGRLVPQILIEQIEVV